MLAPLALLNIFRSMLNFMIVLCIVRLVKCQFSPSLQVPDEFQKEMCRERWHRLDWQQLLQPCIDRTVFGENMLPQTLRTKATWSRTLSIDIKSAGEYSKIVIQSVDQLGRMKTIGGDSWRVLIMGPSSLQPVVYDMNNGLYEVPFLLLEPGSYKADIFLEGTLCNQLFDPPADWFRKGDYNGHFQEDHMYSDKQGWSDLLKERTWDRLGGSSAVIQFQINPMMDQFRYAGNMAKLEQAQQVCNLPTSCDFVWDGFGRWIGQEWKPHNRQDETLEQLSIAELQNAHRRKRGKLWFYGDCFAFHFYEMEHNQTLCKDVFKSCGNSYNWVYPRLNSKPELDPSIHRKDPSDISIEKILTALRKVLQKSNMKKDSALILNYGLHFARSTSFDKYQKLILGVIKELDAYEGQVIWRSTTSVWKQHWKVHKRFQTNQRIQLFNAFAASSFCNAGYPVLDVYPMTSSTSYQPEDGIHYDSWITKPIEKVLINYFIDD